MTVIKSGDLVVLKSGSSVMTVDTVNTDIFDDNKITGVLCVWFVGEKLERVRFDHSAIEPLRFQKISPRKRVWKKPRLNIRRSLMRWSTQMNLPAEETNPASRVVIKKPKPAPKNGIVPASPVR
jgi:uncharacterized protein YodC (DUF2158 family)